MLATPISLPPSEPTEVDEASSVGTEEVFCLGDTVFKSKHSFLRARRSSKRVEKRRVRIALAKVRLKPKLRLARKAVGRGEGGGSDDPKE